MRYRLPPPPSLGVRPHLRYFLKTTRTFVEFARRIPLQGKEAPNVSFQPDICVFERTKDGLSISGELDLNAAPQLKAELIQLIEEGHRDIVVDLTNTTFLDSTALGALAGQFRDLKAKGGSLSVICTNENVLNTLEIAGVTHALRVCRSRDELGFIPGTV
jgi:anti-sigma B factor antagonist